MDGEGRGARGPGESRLEQNGSEGEKRATWRWSKPWWLIPFWLVGEFTTRFRTYFSGDWDVHWGYDLDFDPWPHREY